MFSQSTLLLIAFALLAIMGVIRVFYHYKWKKDPSVTDIEKSLTIFLLHTEFYAATVVVLFLYLPFSTFYPTIDSSAPADKVIEQLVRNQERIGQALSQSKDVLMFFVITTVTYLTSVVSIVRELLQERKKLAPKKAVNVRPLGLDLD